MIYGKTWRWIKSSFAAAVVTLGALLAPGPTANPAALAATSYIVNDNSGDCGSLVETYSNIQSAVTDAIANNVKTILVCPGSYNDFDVSGANSLTIKAAIAGSHPIVNAPSGAVSGAIVDVQNSGGVVLDGLWLTGTLFSTSLSGATYGFYFNNASGTVQNSSVTFVRCYPNSCGLGTGIFVGDNNDDGKVSTLAVKNSNVYDVDSAGMRATGQSKLTVSGSQIIGNVSGGTGMNPTGVEFFYGQASGSVTKSAISKVYTAVSLYSASKVTVSGNAISDAARGVDVNVQCGVGAGMGSSNKITGNTFTSMTSYGVFILSSTGACTHADKNTISGNLIGGTIAGTSGIEIQAAAGASADKNAISGNTIFGFGTDIIIDPDATHTSLSRNTWVR